MGGFAETEAYVTVPIPALGPAGGHPPSGQSVETLAGVCGHFADGFITESRE